MRHVNNAETMQVTRSLAMASDAQGAMVCIGGTDIGKIQTLKSDQMVTVGREPGVCEYVLSDGKISRKHLEITYIGALNKYLVVDRSSNGTLLGNGTRLIRHQEYYLSPRTELYLGSKKNLFKLQ